MQWPSPRRPAGAGLLLALCLLAPAVGVGGQAAPVEYVLRFPAPEHHWMTVEITFRDVETDPLELRMSRSSPGRYALHEFAKNVFDVGARDGEGEPLELFRPDPHQWNVAGHDGTVTVRYRIFGDRGDGTYLQVDPTHAHMNMPATLMWARGFEDRPVELRLVQPEGHAWTAATQLFPTDDPLFFTAPHLQYLMDSPLEFGDTEIRSFEVGDAHRQHIRVALHHQGSHRAADRYLRDVEAIVRETEPIFGEYPRFDGGTYTFIADYLPWADGDGMEHRNSTILTAPVGLDRAHVGLLGTVAHEFFHAWNVERIRPASLEPFDFERANMSGELWLAEGFTSYYGNLILHRAGIADLDRLLGSLGGYVNALRRSPGPGLRSAVEMSRLAPFVDAARPVDATYWDNTFLSYYTFGAALGLGLDLTLRDRSDGAVTLDDYMRALWKRFGAPGSGVGAVARPYTSADAEAVLAEVSGDADFARGFFARYVEGNEVVDYEPLLLRAGLLVRPLRPEMPYIGMSVQETGDGLQVSAPTTWGDPAYEAGIDLGDVVLELDGRRMATGDDLYGVLGGYDPGDTVSIRIRRRGGAELSVPVTLDHNPIIQVVPAERAGERLEPAQREFRRAWLGSRRRGATTGDATGPSARPRREPHRRKSPK